MASDLLQEIELIAVELIGKIDIDELEEGPLRIHEYGEKVLKLREEIARRLGKEEPCVFMSFCFWQPRDREKRVVR